MKELWDSRHVAIHLWYPVFLVESSHTLCILSISFILCLVLIFLVWGHTHQCSGVNSVSEFSSNYQWAQETIQGCCGLNLDWLPKRQAPYLVLYHEPLSTYHNSLTLKETEVVHSLFEAKASPLSLHISFLVILYFSQEGITSALEVINYEPTRKIFFVSLYPVR